MPGYRTDAFDFPPKLHVPYTKNGFTVRDNKKKVNDISKIDTPFLLPEILTPCHFLPQAEQDFAGTKQYTLSIQARGAQKVFRRPTSCFKRKLPAHKVAG